MVSVFTKLEKGQFLDALEDVNQSLKLFVSLSNPRAKEKEIRICATYKFALLLLEEKKKTTPERAAELTYHLTKLNLQPKHRLICIRMAIKSNIQVKNFGYASELIQMILPLNLTDKNSQEEQLELCKQNGLENNHDIASYLSYENYFLSI